MEYKIFIAWQNQNKNVTNFIRNQLRKAKKHMLSKYGISINIIFSPTQEESGSPFIFEKILEQIMTCDVFIGDLTPIYKTPEGKLISNPNVMYETGLAISMIGENGIILLIENDNNTNKIDDLCFDINHNRITPISLNDNNLYKELCDWIQVAIENSIAQKFVDDFIVKDLISDIVIIYNNLFRMIYPYTDYYSPKFNEVSESEIFEKLSCKNLNVFQVKRDYSLIISRISKKTKELSNINRYKRLVQELVLLCNTLSDYNDINIRSSYNFFKKIKVDSASIYGLTDGNGINLDGIENYDVIKDSLVFRQDSCILTVINDTNENTTSGSMFDIFIKDSITNAIQSVDEALVNYDSFTSHVKGTNFYMNIPIYTISNEQNITKYSNLIYTIISSINNILNILKLKPTDIIHGTNKHGYLISFINALY
ncbi:TIR domain-containing protein [Clostridium sp. C8-1-8]|uniref:TIR domain-containing protein n=1 Tax=Clostridium sp. C8-1-8 TaxID=2698831 RepID=UPI00136BC58A|nr:TIR domain-containing protein [Clostridium sp. C8-1-8]